MTPSACPERGALQAMVRGDMSDDLFERLVRHLEECPSCQAALDELSQADATWTLCRRVWRDLAPPGYTLRELIGRGGMGLVFRAWDVRLEREVAIKCIQERFAHSPTARERFFSEAKITGRLQHPGIPAVHELGTLPDGRPYLAMKLVHGQTLSQIIRSASRHRLLAILEQVSHAVGYAHAHRVIHRDLKPSNIMVGAHGEVQVMDWGLAKVLACASSVSAESTVRDADDPSTASALDKTPDPFTEGTATGEVVGTPAYMPPEQAAGQVHRVDPRSDVFALGAILCEILTGYPPYTGGRYFRRTPAGGTRRLDAGAAPARCRGRRAGIGTVVQAVPVSRAEVPSRRCPRRSGRTGAHPHCGRRARPTSGVGACPYASPGGGRKTSASALASRCGHRRRRVVGRYPRHYLGTCTGPQTAAYRPEQSAYRPRPQQSVDDHL
ncbi:MAG: hypothetical protein C4297_10895 [Gemmataceae bacterium]